MATLPEEYRQKAQEQRELSLELLKAPDVLTSATKLVSAIAGQINATVLTGLADLMDYQRVTTGQDSRVQKMQAYMERNALIRNAAAKGQASGDWSDWEKLVGAGDPINGVNG